MPALAYVRVSTEDQRRSGLGLEAQTASVRAAAEREGLELAGIAVEIESGARHVTDRPVLRGVLEQLRAGDVLIVHDQDRLGRRLRALGTIEDLEDLGVRVLVARGHRWATADLITAVHGGMAVEERKKIKERTRAALRAKQKRGEWVGRPPTGYLVRREPDPADPKRMRSLELIPDPAKARLRRRVRKLALAGKSLRQIAEAVGVPRSTLHRALRNGWKEEP